MNIIVILPYNRPMYALASKLKSLPIVSLQTGETVGVTKQSLIDPGTLEVVGFLCEDARRTQKVLILRDIRQLAIDCAIIDSEDELTDPEDIVRLQPLIKELFTPIGKPVVTDLGRKLGNVEDYTINLETNRIQKLYIRQSILRSLLGSSLIIDRMQIIDVSPKQIVVRDTHIKAPVMAPESAPETTP